MLSVVVVVGTVVVFSVTSRPKMIAVNRYGRPKKCPQKDYTASKNRINESKKVSLLIKRFVVDKKKHAQKAVNNAVFYGSLKNPTLNTEINNNLLPWYKVKCKRKTHHFFKRGITWYLHWKKVTNKKLERVKVFYKGLIRHI